MSKLSFRARALDAAKPLPIYRGKDMPDLNDCVSINRAVPQMPTGMEKEEESVRERGAGGAPLFTGTPRTGNRPPVFTKRATLALPRGARGAAQTAQRKPRSGAASGPCRRPPSSAARPGRGARVSGGGSA